MNKKILLIGGGGHCKSVLDTLLLLNEYNEIAIVDLFENIGKSIMEIPIIGSDTDLAYLFKDGYEFAFITMGSIGNPKLRIKLYDEISLIGFKIPNIIDISANVSNFTELGKGIFIGKKSIVNAGAIVGNGAIINTGSIIEHDCKIGEFVHIAPGAILGGAVEIGKNSHVGSGAIIKQQIKIGYNSIIGMGSIVTKIIGNNKKAYGNPCREVNDYE